MNAKAVLVVCLLIASTSAYLGSDFHAKARSASTQAMTAKKDAQQASETLVALQEVLKQDTAPQPLERVSSQALLNIYNMRTAHGVNVNQLSPGKLGASVDTPVTELAEDVPGSSLKSVKVNLTGTYTSYFGLLNYIKALQTGPVALTRLKVQDNSFEMSVRVYGTVN